MGDEIFQEENKEEKDSSQDNKPQDNKGNKGNKSNKPRKPKKEAEITVAQFCGITGVKQLDKWVAGRFFDSKDRRTEKDWGIAFDEKKIPYNKKR